MTNFVGVLLGDLNNAITLYNNCKCIYKNSLQNVIKNYVEGVSRQCLIKTKDAYYVVYSYNS